MADQPKRTGVYETPGTTTNPVTDGRSPAAHSPTAGRAGAIPSWLWIVAAVIVLAVLGVIFL